MEGWCAGWTTALGNVGGVVRLWMEDICIDPIWRWIVVGMDEMYNHFGKSKCSITFSMLIEKHCTFAVLLKTSSGSYHLSTGVSWQSFGFWSRGDAPLPSIRFELNRGPHRMASLWSTERSSAWTSKYCNGRGSFSSKLLNGRLHSSLFCIFQSWLFSSETPFASNSF